VSKGLPEVVHAVVQLAPLPPAVCASVAAHSAQTGQLTVISEKQLKALNHLHIEVDLPCWYAALLLLQLHFAPAADSHFLPA
jgi:hypothetical protein